MSIGYTETNTLVATCATNSYVNLVVIIKRMLKEQYTIVEIQETAGTTTVIGEK